MSAEARAEMAQVLSEQFFAWDAMREQRDEALARADEFEAERDQARRIAVSLEAEVAQVRQIHKPFKFSTGDTKCGRCWVKWPCDTAEAVYLTDGGGA